MKITITDKKTIEEIQEEFTKEFTYLKIQFFKHGHKAFKGNSKKELIPEATTFSSIKHLNGTVEITESMKVSELEQLFKDRLELNIQVFRKSGKSWLETTVTDNWTLKKQNDEGKELSVLEI